MQRQVYVRFEERDNTGSEIKSIERLCVFEDKDDEDVLTEILESWAAETAKSMATIMSITRETIRKMRLAHIKRLVS